MTELNFVDLKYHVKMLRILGIRLFEKPKIAKRLLINIQKLMVFLSIIINLIGMSHFLLYNLDDLFSVADNVQNLSVNLITFAKMFCIHFQQKRLEELVMDVETMSNGLRKHEHQYIVKSALIGKRITNVAYCCGIFTGGIYTFYAFYLTITGTPRFPLNFS
jgi:hypothetical protein